MERWILETRYAVRRLRRRPTYALLAVLTLALGIGGTAAIAGIVRALLVEPLPYRDESHLVVFWNPFDWSAQELSRLRPEWKGFGGLDAVAGYAQQDLTLEQDNAPTRSLNGIAATSELFDVIGVKPMLGSGFRAGDDAVGAEAVVVLSHTLWRELGADPAIIGTRVRIGGARRTVVGVMPRGFWFPDPTARAWVPIVLNPQNRSGNYALVGRLTPATNPEHLETPISKITKYLGEQWTYPPQWDKTKNAKLTPVREFLVGSLRPGLLATLAAMAAIMLIACANVAALMLGQVESRSTELAVRSALGADRGRLTSQIVMEALVLGFFAGVVGSLFAVGCFNLLLRALPLGGWGERATLDWTLFALAMIVALVGALLVALLPSYSLRRSDLRTKLAGVRTGGIVERRGGIQGLLVIAEVAVAVVLACGAGLLVRSVSKLYAISPGVQTEGIAVLDVATSTNMRSAQRIQVVSAIVHELQTIPGVKAVAATHLLPLRGGGSSTGFVMPGTTEQDKVPTTYFRFVTRDYFAALGIPLRSGENFTGTEVRPDTVSKEVSIVINEALAKKFFPGRNPIGQVVGFGFGNPERIIGVVGDVTEGSLTEGFQPARYYLSEQAVFTPSAQTFVIRASNADALPNVIEAARRAISKVAPSAAVQNATSMQRVLDLAVGPARQVMSLVALLTGLALVLGAIGIYGVIAHFVARRKRDWSIRVALGLPPSRVVRHVVGVSTSLVGVGVVVGLIGAVTLSRLLASLLYNISSSDPYALSIAALMLVVVGVLAALIPALRASRTDPALVLREQ